MIESKKDSDKNKNDGNKNDGNKNNRGIDKKEKDQEPPIVTLKVSEAYHKDVGRGIARIDPVTCKKMDFVTGDAIELSVSLPRRGNNDNDNEAQAVVLNWPAYEEDYGKGLIRIDGYTRSKLGIGINGTVEVKKIESKDAISITLAPTEPLRIVGAEQYLSELLQGTLVTEGDIIPLGIMGQRIDLEIVSTNPLISRLKSLQRSLFQRKWLLLEQKRQLAHYLLPMKMLEA